MEKITNEIADSYIPELTITSNKDEICMNEEIELSLSDFVNDGKREMKILSWEV